MAKIILPALILIFSLPPPSGGAHQSYRKYQEECGLPARAASAHFTVFAPDETTARMALLHLEKTLTGIKRQFSVHRIMTKHCLVFIWKDEKEYARRAVQYIGASAASEGCFALGEEGVPYRIFLHQDRDLFSRISWIAAG